MHFVCLLKNKTVNSVKKRERLEKGGVGIPDCKGRAMVMCQTVTAPILDLSLYSEWPDFQLINAYCLV